MGQVTKEAFEQDKVLKEEFGSYENYLSQNGGNSDSKSSVVVPNNGEVEGGQNPTFNDYVSVENSGKLPEEEPKSAYDMYMEEAKNIYNQGVETNNKNAANQAASAGAQYREVNRNLGEINKANGKADTGYAGDTSIDAYNAYRNSVNKSYSDANSANNELYSYYLTKMTELQQAKDNKEATDRQLEQTDRQLALQEQQYQDTKAAETADNIEVLKGENAYDSSGYITSETAERLWKYVKGVYGEDIPDNVMANLNSEKGFAEWLVEYNNQTSSNYSNDVIYSPEITLDSDADLGNASDEEKNDDFKIHYNGTGYKLEVKEKVIGELYDYLDTKLNKENGSIIYYNGRIYVRTKNGHIFEAGSSDSSLEDKDLLIEALKKDGKIK